MNAGVIEQFGAPAKIFSSPRSRFVADFVGHKNMLEGRSSRANPTAAVMRPGGLSDAGSADTAGPAMASIPVHRLQIARKPLAAANCYEAKSTHVAYLGPFMQISVKLGGSDARNAPACRRPRSKPCASATASMRPGTRGDVILIPTDSEV